MARIIKGRQMTARYWKGREVLKEYKQGRLVYEKSSSIPSYLCFTALEAGQFTLTIPAAVTPTYLSYVEWSKDGRTWNHRDNSSDIETIDVQVAQGEKVYWRGSGVRMSANYTTGNNSNFSSDCEFTISGHLLSLLKLSDYENMSGIERYTFCTLFNACSGLLSAEDLVLPSTCIDRMYIWTFRLCENMVKGPKLLAPDIPTYGYNAMFSSCRKLQSIDLSAVQTYSTTAFQNMCGACNSLNYVKCLLDPTISASAFSGWLASTSSTGTFIQASGVTWPRGASGIPTGWVDVEKRTMPQGYKQVEYVANPNKPSAAPMPLVDTGVVLNPSQDTMEIAVFPHIGDDGYIAHHQYGGLPIANSMSPAQSGAKVGRFYCIYRKPASGNNLIQFSWTKETSANSNLATWNKIAETPQVLRIELSSGDNEMLLNGTQIATNSDACDMSDPGTETAKLFGINNVGYNWIDPIYYYKHWRSGVLIADYVPCIRESDNEVSFYDFVSNTFKVPTKTGFFTAGEEI